MKNKELKEDNERLIGLFENANDRLLHCVAEICYLRKRCALAEHFADPDPLYLSISEKRKFDEWQELKLVQQL